MLYLIVDSIAEFLGSHFRCNNYPIIYVLIRTIVLGLFNFFVSTIYVYFESDDFGTDNIVFNFLVVLKSDVLAIYLSYPDYISIKIYARQLHDFLSSSKSLRFFV